ELVGQRRGLDGVSPAIIFARETEAAAIGIYRAAQGAQNLAGKSQGSFGSGLRNGGTRSRHRGKIYRCAPLDVGILQGFKQRCVLGDYHQVIFLQGRDIDRAYCHPGHKQDAALMQLRSRVFGGIKNKSSVIAADTANGLDKRSLLHLHHFVCECGLKSVPGLGRQIGREVERVRGFGTGGSFVGRLRPWALARASSEQENRPRQDQQPSQLPATIHEPFRRLPQSQQGRNVTKLPSARQGGKTVSSLWFLVSGITDSVMFKRHRQVWVSSV